MLIRFLDPTHKVLAEWDLDDAYSEHTVRMTMQEAHNLAYGMLAHRATYLEVRSRRNDSE